MKRNELIGDLKELGIAVKDDKVKKADIVAAYKTQASAGKMYPVAEVVKNFKLAWGDKFNNQDYIDFEKFLNEAAKDGKIAGGKALSIAGNWFDLDNDEMTGILTASFKVKASQNKILLTDSVDLKDFRKLMAKHAIKILSETKDSKGVVFTLSNSTDLEDIMVETRMHWEFV